MKEPRLEPDSPAHGVISYDARIAADTDVSASSYASTVSSMPVESLEVHDQPAKAQVPAPMTDSRFKAPFSRRKAAVVSSIITVLVVLLTGGTLAVLSRESKQPDASSRLNLSSQDIQLKNQSNATAPAELQGVGSAVLINGDLIARGQLKVTNGAYVTVLRSANLTSNRNLTLPNASGTLCVDSNNCGYATTAQLQDLQSRLGQVVVPVVPDATTVNGQGGAVSVQGTSNQISVTTANGVIALSTPQDIAPISSPTFANLLLNGNFSVAGTVTLPLNCSGMLNGGALTTNASGQIICSGDDSASGGGGGAVTTAGGTAGNLALFTAADTIADSVISQALGAITIGGNTTINGTLSANSLTLATALSVANGGTGATTFTTNGVLVGNGTGAVTSTTAPTAGQVLLGNASNVPQFTTISGDVAITAAGVTAIQADSVALGVDTTGNYVANLGTLTGLTTSGNTGEGSTPTLSVVYGSTANTSVQGNTSISVTAGTNLTGGGSITLGSGGTVTLNVTNSPTFGGNIIAQGGSVTIGTTSAVGYAVLHDGNGQIGSLTMADLTAGRTYTFPDATGTVCLSTGNCVGGTGGAPNAATYLTIGNNATLTNERSITAGSNVSFTDGGANGTFTIDTVNNPNFSTSVTTPLLQSSGALSITPSGALTVGATGQTALLQGSTTTITSNGVGNDIVLTSADQIRLTGFNCTTYANGGTLTTDASGNITCADDDGGAGGAITGSGTNGRIALFTGSQTMADSWLLQNGSTLELDNTRNLSLLGGNFSVTGTGTFSGLLTANGSLTIESGDTFTMNGDAFTDLTGTGLVISSGSLQTTLGTSVDLASEVTGTLSVTNGGTGVNGSTAANGQLLIGNGTGYTLATLTQGDGITITNAAGSITVANAFGTEVDLGVETAGNYQASTAAGNGISVSGTAGEGWTATVALGALTANWDQTGAFDIVLNNANSELRVLESAGGTYFGTIDVGDLTADRTYTFPDASGTICLSTGNCAGAGGGITGSGTSDTIAKFTGAGTIGDSSISDDGSVVTLNGTANLVIQGGTATFGTTTQAGTLTISDGSSNTVSIVASAFGGDYTYTLPDVGGAATFCMSTGNCVGGGGGGAPNAAAYLVASLDGTLTNERALNAGSNISLTDGGAGGNFTVATVQNPTFTTSVTTPLLQSSGALTLVSAAGEVIAVDAGTTIELQDSTNVTGSLDISVALNVGTSNAFQVNSSGAISAAAGITSSGTVTFSALNCTTFTNGGKLTTNGSGQLTCANDSGAAAGTITGTGTNGTLPMFTATNVIADSIVTQSGTTVNIAGDLTLSTDLAVAQGGTGAGSFTSNGVLYGNGTGALQVTAAGTSGQVLVANASGVPAFVSFSGDVFVSDTGVTTIQANSVTLGTDTTGNYVRNLGTLTGLTTTGNTGEAATPTLSVDYGSTANTAVQGNTTLVCPSGTGNLTGGGTSITMGTGGTCAALDTVNNPTFSASVTTPLLQNAGLITLGTTATAGADDIVLQTAGSEKLRVLENGNLQFAATGTTHTISVATPLFDNGEGLRLESGDASATNGSGGHLVLQAGEKNGTGTAGTVIIQAPATVGNGTILSINGNSFTDMLTFSEVGNQALLSLGQGDGGSQINLRDDNAVNWAIRTDDFGTLGNGTNHLGFYLGGTTPVLHLNDNGSAIWRNSVDSTTAFQIQGNDGSPDTIFNVDTTNKEVEVGDSDVVGTLVLSDGSSNTVTITPAAFGGNYTYTIPDVGGAATFCMSTGNCAGAGATLQSAYNNSTNPEIVLDSTRGALTVRDNATPISGNLLEVQNNAGGITYFGVTSTGANVRGILSTQGSIEVTGSGNFSTYTAPGGGTFNARLNVGNDDPGSFGQMIAAGVTSTAQSTARGLSLFDARTSAHQQTLAVFSPDQNSTVGLTWNGSNLTATAGTSDILSGNTDAFVVQSGNVTGGNGSSGEVQVTSGSIAGGTGFTTGDLKLLTGNGTGTNSSSGNIVMDVGTKTGTGTNGTITIGATNASAVTISRTGVSTTVNGTLTVAQLATFNGGLTVAANQSITMATGSGQLQFDTDGQVYIRENGSTDTDIMELSARVGFDFYIDTSNYVFGISQNGKTTVQAASDAFGGLEVLQTNGNHVLRVLTSGTEGEVRVGYASDTEATLFILDNDTDQTSDPTGVEGGMYYNNGLNKFRCYQNTGWVDCISPTGASTTLQQAYDFSSNPEITLDNTRGALTVRDNATPITVNGGNLLEVQNNAGTTTYLSVASTGLTVNTVLSAGVGGTGNSITSNVSTTSGMVTGNRLDTALNPASNSSADIIGTSNTISTSGSANFSGDLIASLGQINWAGTGTSSDRLMGSVGKVVASGGSGAIQTAVGVMAEGQFQGGAVTNYYGLYSTMNSLNNVAIQNAYGLKIDNFAAIGSAAPTNFYAIAADGGMVRFTGNSAYQFQVQNAALTPVLNVDTTTTNLIANPSIEVDTTGWAAKGAATISRSAAITPYDANFALRVDATAAAGDGARFSYNLAGSTQYTLSFFAKAASGNGFSALQAGRSDDGSTDTACTLSPDPSGFGAGVNDLYWKRYSCTFTTGAVSGARYVYIKQTDATARTFYIDAVQLETGASATIYRSGKTAIGGNLVVNGGQPEAGASDVTLKVNVLAGGHGLIIKASGANDLFKSLLDVRNADDTISYLNVNEVTRGTSIRGGNSAFSAAALEVTSIQDSAVALRVNAASGQTADIFQVYDAAGTPNKLLSVGVNNITIGNASMAQTVTVGSMNTTSTTTIQGGTNGITLQTADTTLVTSSATAAPVLEVQQVANSVAGGHGLLVRGGTNPGEAAFEVRNSGNTAIFSVDTSNSRTTVGSGATCTGRLCVGQSSSGAAGGATTTNLYNIQNINISSGTPTYVGQNIVMNDTSSAQTTTLRPLILDTTGSTNTSAVINSIQAMIPSNANGTFLQFQNGATDVLNVANSGATTFRTTTASVNAFRIQNAVGGTVFNLDTTTGSANLVTNASFETNTTGWTARTGTANMVRNTSHPLFGAAGMSFDTNASDEGVNYPIQLSPSTQYTVSFYSKNLTSTTSSFVVGYAEDGSTETTHLSGGLTSSTNGWNKHELTFTTGATVNGAAYLFIKTTSATARTFVIDGVQIIASQYAGAYRESSLSLHGTVISTPLQVQTVNNNETALSIMSSEGIEVFNVNTTEKTVSINTSSFDARFNVNTSGSMDAIRVTNSGTGSLLDLIDTTSGGTTSVFTVADEGAATFRSRTNMASAFQVQDSAAASLFTVDTTTRSASGGNLIKIGNSTGTDGALTILKLDSATADPTSNLSALSGGLYYNSTTNKVQIIENGVVKELCNKVDTGCGAAGPSLGKDLAVADTSTSNFAGTMYTFTQQNTGAAGVLSLANAGTSSTLRVASTGNASANNALVFGQLSNASVSGNLLDLRSGASGSETSKLTVAASGATTIVGVNGANGTTGTAAATILSVTGGNGGTGSSLTGGEGGGISLQSGTGGLGSGGGGNGGALNFTTGNGGADNGLGALGGNGGAVTIATGNGGTSSNGSGGWGGNITLQAGNGGAATGADGSGGTIILKPGAAGGALGGNGVVQIGSTTVDSSQYSLVLDSSTTFSDSGICSASVNPGALYFSNVTGSSTVSGTSAIRTCVPSTAAGGGWQDVVTSDVLGALLFGVVPDSGANKGDVASLSTTGLTGPCKVSAASATAVRVESCVAYTAGRRVTVNQNTSLTIPVTSGWTRICLTGTGLSVQATNNASETSMPSFMTPSLQLCLAHVKTNGTTITQVYDTRTFTTTQKEYYTVATAVSIGQVVTISGSSIAPTSATPGAGKILGVVVATDGSTSSTTAKALVATSGPAWVKATAGAVGEYVQNDSQAGYVNTNATAPTAAYSVMGIARTAFAGANCTTTPSATNCNGSIYLVLNIR